jgi:hypothetical protein
VKSGGFGGKPLRVVVVGVYYVKMWDSAEEKSAIS